jgi:hypothetical protein
MHHKVIAVRSVSDTTLNSVAQHGATTEIRDVNPQLVVEVVLNQVIMEISEGDAGLNQCVRSVNVHFEDLVHVFAQIKANGSWHSWSRTAISDIAPDGERPEWDLELVAQSDYGLDIWHIAGRDNGRRDEILFADNVVHVVNLGRVQVVFVAEFLRLGDDGHIVVSADFTGTFDEVLERVKADARRKTERLASNTGSFVVGTAFGLDGWSSCFLHDDWCDKGYIVLKKGSDMQLVLMVKPTITANSWLILSKNQIVSNPQQHK